MLAFIKRFLSDEEGATAVEYAVMLACILLVCIGAVVTMGQQTQSSWQDSSDRLSAIFGGP